MVIGALQQSTCLRWDIVACQQPTGQELDAFGVVRCDPPRSSTQSLARRPLRVAADPGSPDDPTTRT
jgi:hypothetical protein